MKIAVIDPWCFTPPYNRALCSALASIGHEVVLIGQDQSDGDACAADGREAGFLYRSLFTAPSSRLPRHLALAVKGLRHMQGMFRSLLLLRRLRPDVIHIQWLALPLIDAFFIPILRRIAPVVLTVHDSNPYNGAGPLLLRLGHMMAIRRFDRWIVHNDMSARHLAERGLDVQGIHRVAHGLLSPPVDATCSGRGQRREGGPVRFLQFGKLKDYKGADVLLEAVSLLSEDQRTRCRVSIVGRPYMETKPLEDLVALHRLEASVELRFDFVSDDEMAALLDGADFLVFPYRAIDTSGVLMAAIARGIPVVASKIGCFEEMLVDGEEARLVPADDPRQLAAALGGLIDDPTQADHMRSRMAALQRRIPSWQRIAETTTEVYEQAQTPLAPTPVGAHPCT